MRRNLNSASTRSSRNQTSLSAYYELLEQRSALEKKNTKKQLDFIEAVIRIHSRKPVRRVLDIACGRGRHIVGLAQHGYECTGYDLSADQLRTAKARAERAGVSVRLVRVDATKLPKNSRFDVILAISVIFLLPSHKDIREVLQRIHEILSPGGILVCNIYNPWTTGTHWIKDLLNEKLYKDEIRARGIRMREVYRLRELDPIGGVLWADYQRIVETSDGQHVFRIKDSGVRLLTFWDVKHHLEDAGFSQTVTYTDWKLKSTTKPKAEQIIFVAKR